MDTLAALDAEFLHLEDARSPLHIGGFVVFDGPPPELADVRALLGAKLDLIPRYRQRVRGVPLELGRPVWVDDPQFSLEHHVHSTAVPHPGGRAELQALMSRVMSQQLDRDRPLWEVWLVEGLEHGQWALLCKVHHCMVDGLAGVALLTVMLDLSPEAALPEPPPWDPAPEPSRVAMVLGAWGGLAHGLEERAGQLGRLLVDPVGLVRTGVATVEGLAGFARHLGTCPESSIEGPVGPHRTWATSSVPLADVKTVAHALGGTVNDVVLAAVTSGLRDLLRSHGDPVESAVIRTGVPVSMRTADGSGVPDNRVSAVLIELPVAVADPLERFRLVREAMQTAKASHMAEAGDALAHVAEVAPPMLLGIASRLLLRVMHRLPQRSITTLVTNVPGPQFPLYCLGREMTRYLPYVPIIDGVRVGTAILSYNGTLAFGITGDEDSVPDVAVLADGIVAGIDELLALAAPAPRRRSKSR